MSNHKIRPETKVYDFGDYDPVPGYRRKDIHGVLSISGMKSAKSREEYHPGLSDILAKFSDTSYFNSNTANTLAATSGIKQFSFIRDEDTGVEAVVAVYSDVIVISFRGTQGFKDILTDLNAAPVPFDVAPQGAATQDIFETQRDTFWRSEPLAGARTPVPHVHTGFYQSFKSIEPRIVRILDNIEQEDRDRAEAKGKSEPPARQIFISGHSLGGGISITAAADLKEAGYDIAGVYTFGQPAAGDGQFANHYASLGLDKITKRIVNQNDIIARVPPSWLPPFYSHVGEEIYFDGSGTRVRPSNTILESLSHAAKRFWDEGTNRQSGYFVGDQGADHPIARYREILERDVERDRSVKKNHVKKNR